MKDGKLTDCKFEEDTTIMSDQKMQKFRTSLGTDKVDRMDSDVGQMVLTFGLSNIFFVRYKDSGLDRSPNITRCSDDHR